MTNIQILEKLGIDYKGLKSDKPLLLFSILKAMDVARQDQQQVNSVDLADVVGSLPNPYEGELNTERIAEYRKLKPLYALDGGSIRDLFCSGVNWYKSVIERQ